MQVCPNCKHLNQIGTVFCEECGASLIGEAPLWHTHDQQRCADRSSRDLGSHQKC